MSVVTNLIFSFCICEDEEERAKEVNRYFADSKPLVSVEYDESYWYGGTKALETPIYIGAFNYTCFDLDEFIHHVKSIEWRYPEMVQIIVQEQDDDKFRIIEIV